MESVSATLESPLDSSKNIIAQLAALCNASFRCQPRSSLQSVLWLDDYHCCNSAGIINHGSMPASIAQTSCDTSARSRSFVLLAYHAR
jgi:hypothetical protein